MWTKEFIDTVIRKYLLGASVFDICTSLGTQDNKEIEEIIDTFLRSEGWME